jgi:flagellar basal-body rod modification protein FlgD
MIGSTTNTTNTGSTGQTSGAPNSQVNQPGGAMGKDQFMKLLIAQMQNQDPMNPMQGDQMAAQLAQFSTLEQMQQMNSTLTDQSSAQGALLGAMQSGAAINTLGHNVVAIGNQVQIGGDNGSTSVTADVPSTATSATLHIYDSTGKEVGKRDLGAIQAGDKQSFQLGDAAKGLATGSYTYSIDAKDTAGAAVDVTTYMTGKVDGVSSSSSGLVLNAGGMTIPYSAVVKVIN